jgi:hypothetical protein
MFGKRCGAQQCHMYVSGNQHRRQCSWGCLADCDSSSHRAIALSSNSPILSNSSASTEHRGKVPHVHKNICCHKQIVSLLLFCVHPHGAHAPQLQLQLGAPHTSMPRVWHGKIMGMRNSSSSVNLLPATSMPALAPPIQL